MDVNDPAVVVDRIYEAALVPELWPEVLRGFAAIAESREAALVASGDAGLKWVCSSPTAEDIARQNYNYPGGQERTRRLIAREHAGFLTDHDVFSEEEFLTEPLFAEFLIPNGYGRGIATSIAVPTGDSIIFHAEGNFASGRATPELLARLDVLRPHLARAALLSARLAFERTRTAVETLAGLGLGACAVTASGTVITANQQFEKESALWTTRSNNRIALHDKRADDLLTTALEAVRLHETVRSIPLLPSEETELPAVLHVVPVMRAAHDLFGRATAVLVLTKASTDPTAATPLLQALFDLTPTEAQLAARVAAGQTAESIAVTDRKTVGTVRNQLKSVLTKTGCRRQVDLARLLAQLVPGGR
jgi:DNA-binding CsgD family transcriptional regulator